MLFMFGNCFASVMLSVSIKECLTLVSVYADNETDTIRVILLLALWSSALKENLHDVHKLMELSYQRVRTLLSPTDSCRNPAGIRGFREFRRNQIWHRSQPKWEFHSGGIPTGICIFPECRKDDRNGIRPECDICIVYYI